MSMRLISKEGCPGGRLYRIMAGDTLYLIARKFGVTVDSLLQANPGVDPQNLRIGSMICIPGLMEPGECPGGMVYVIRAGDTFYQLARRFGVSLESILKANPELDPDRLKIGQRVCIPNVEEPDGFPCCTLLEPTEKDTGSVGACLVSEVQSSEDGSPRYSVTFVATGLPTPSELGNYDTYVGLVLLPTGVPADPPPRFGVELASVLLSEQPTTWSGTRIISEMVVAGTVLQIRPFNTETGMDTRPVLAGEVR